ncbi:C40 family peptidase [Aurantibacter sp.]|uniref:C40 family peptidase n=1 Tax=Aurantibacter sp. TaxID=2807103 RepID=UPI0035C8482F
MKKITLILTLLIILSSCGSRKSKHVNTRKSSKTTTKHNTKPKSTSTNYSSKTVNNIVSNAKVYLGVNYKTGGTTKKGMDCSGLIYTAFGEENIPIPRVSRDMAKKGTWIDVKAIKKGDLIFFATSKNSRNINHVGLVTESRTGYVKFIHSSSSKGVMESMLSERYWYLAYVQARRVL